MKKFILAWSVIAVLGFAGVAAAEPIHISATPDTGVITLASHGSTWRCRKCGRVVHKSAVPLGYSACTSHLKTSSHAFSAKILW
jgi:hypothetical protein